MQSLALWCLPEQTLSATQLHSIQRHIHFSSCTKTCWFWFLHANLAWECHANGPMAITSWDLIRYGIQCRIQTERIPFECPATNKQYIPHIWHGERDHDLLIHLWSHRLYREYTVPFRVHHSNTFPLPNELSFPISLSSLSIFLSFPFFFKFSFPDAAPHELVTHRAACRVPFPFIKSFLILLPQR